MAARALFLSLCVVALVMVFAVGCGGGGGAPVTELERDDEWSDEQACEGCDQAVGEEAPAPDYATLPPEGEDEVFEGDPYDLEPELRDLATTALLYPAVRSTPSLCLPWKPAERFFCTNRGHRRPNGSAYKAADFAMPVGTAVKAARGGYVVIAKRGYNWGYGNYVVVRHTNRWAAWTTLYAHLDSISVSKGQHVRRHQTLGRSGNTGNSTGPHLHFEVRNGRTTVEPAPISCFATLRAGRWYKHRTNAQCAYCPSLL